MSSESFPLGGPVPIEDIDSLWAQGAGRVAVEAYNEQYGESLEFKRTVNGTNQLLGPLDINLVLVVEVSLPRNNGITWTYKTEYLGINFRPWPRVKELKSFDPVINYPN